MPPPLPLGAPLPGFRPASHPPRARMAGRFVTLEPTVPADAVALFAAFAQDAGAADWTYLSYGPFDDVAALEAWIAHTCQSDDPLFFTIREREGGRAAGLAAFLRIKPDMGVIEVGHIHFAPALQRHPGATEAMALMMARAFDLGYRRTEWKCDTLNARSRRAATRLGFTFEGIFRQAMVIKGRNRDTAWYSVIDSEWPRLKAGFDAWLSAENFDAAGHQRRPLSACRPATRAES